MAKSDFLRYAVILAVICVAAAGLLSAVYGVTQPKIAAQRLAEEEESLKDVYPAAATFEPVTKDDTILYYRALDDKRALLGYAFKAVRRGYSSDIVTMAGMTPEGRIVRIEVLSQNETPGLGTRVTEVIQKETLWDVLLRRVKVLVQPRPWFQERFDGKDAATLGQTVDAITGATISSSTVIASVKEKALEVLRQVNDGR
ncbi:MAG: FMN-binding protein [Deltaproteobacteria bacterium]